MSLVTGRGKKNQKTASVRISLSDEAYAIIKQKILTLTYEPGTYLNEATLSDSLEIGRTPVHHAVKRLTLEGLIEIMPRKGFIVKPLNLRELKDIIEMRMVNEVYCVRKAAQLATTSHLQSMATVLKKTYQASRQQNTEKLMVLDQEFHALLSEAAANQVLGEILKNLHERSLRYWFISLQNQHDGATVSDEHQAIYDAISLHDQDLAAQCMREHIEAFRENIIQYI